MLQFTRVDSIETTERGLEAALHGERLRIEPVRDDVVRMKISRGGVFDEAPTFAVCVDPLAEPVEFTVERDDEGCAAHGGAHRDAVAGPVPARRPPRRRHRAWDCADAAGPLLGVRHAQRRVQAPAPLPAGGRDLRPGGEGRPAQPQGPRLHAVEHRRPQPRRDRGVTAGKEPATRVATTASSSTRTTCRSRSSTTTPGRAHGGLVHRQRLPRPRTSSPAEEYAIRFEGGQYTEYVFAGPRMPDDPRGLHVADRARRAAAAVVARLPPVPLVRLHAGRGRGARPQRHRDARHPVRRAVARHRVHGRLPRLHLEHASGSPTRPGCCSACTSRASG